MAFKNMTYLFVFLYFLVGRTLCLSAAAQIAKLQHDESYQLKNLHAISTVAGKNHEIVEHNEKISPKKDLILFAKAEDKKKKADKDADKNEDDSPNEVNRFLHFLPFGGGQFVNDEPLLGSVFAATQAIGLIYAGMSWTNGNAEVDTVNSYIDDRNLAYDNTLPSARTAHEQETSEKVAEHDKKIADYEKGILTGLIIAGLSYSSSIITAFVQEPDISTIKKKRRRRKRKSRRKAKTTKIENVDYDEQAMANIDWPSDHKITWNFSPVLSKESLNSKYYAMQVQLKF